MCLHTLGDNGEEAGCSQQEDKAEALPAATEAPCHNQNPFGFPLSLVKRIMCMDPDVTRISGAHTNRFDALHIQWHCAEPGAGGYCKFRQPYTFY